MTNSRKFLIKREVRKILNQLSVDTIQQGPAIILESIVAHLGLVIRRFPMHKLISGILLFDGDDWVVGINSCQSKSRQMFTTAHEIAHYVLDKDNSVCPVTVNIDNLRQYTIERRADVFAAELLMPKQLLLPYIRKGYSPEAVAKMFGLSVTTVKIRYEELSAAV